MITKSHGILCLLADCLGAATMGLVVRSTTNGVIGLLRVRLLAVALRAACEAVGSVGDGFLHLVHGGLLGVRSHLLLSLGGEILAAGVRHIDDGIGIQRKTCV